MISQALRAGVISSAPPPPPPTLTGQVSNYDPRWRHREPDLSSVPLQNNGCTAGYGSIKTDPFNILSEQKLSYQDLYTSKNVKADSMQTAKSFLSNLDIPRLTEEQKLPCEGKITPEECPAEIVNFQNNKSPGNDGIPVEFYKKILVTFKRIFHEMRQ